MHDLAQKESSDKAMSLLVTRMDQAVQYAADPFVKVREMVQNMINTLRTEEQKENTHDNYCRKETANTKTQLAKLETTKDRLTTSLDERNARAATLQQQIGELSKQLAELDNSTLKLNKIRLDEHSAYEELTESMTPGLEGVRTALQMMRDFYSNQIGPATLLQVSEDEDPAILNRPIGRRTKENAASGGVIGLLEVIESDFGRTLVEAETAEDAAAQAYKDITDENKLTKAEKQADRDFKSKTVDALMLQVKDLVSDNEANQLELDALLEYKKTIDDACIEKIDMAESLRRRKEEIAGLKDALRILDEEGALMGGALGTGRFIQLPVSEKQAEVAPVKTAEDVKIEQAKASEAAVKSIADKVKEAMFSSESSLLQVSVHPKALRGSM